MAYRIVLASWFELGHGLECVRSACTTVGATKLTLELVAYVAEVTSDERAPKAPRQNERTRGRGWAQANSYLPYLPILLPPDKVVFDDPPQFDPVGVRRGAERRASTSQDDQARSHLDDTPQVDPVRSRRPSDGAPRIAEGVTSGMGGNERDGPARAERDAVAEPCWTSKNRVELLHEDETRYYRTLRASRAYSLGKMRCCMPRAIARLLVGKRCSTGPNYSTPWPIM